MSFFFGVTVVIEVDATPNGDTVEITVYEDTTGDGTADNGETFAVGAGRNEFSPTRLEMVPGNEIWWALTAIDDGDPTTAVDGLSVTVEY